MANIRSAVDPAFYGRAYPDLAHLTADELVGHYEEYGQHEGRVPFHGATRETFMELLPATGLTLEIGPFARPAITGSHVRYADVMDAERIKEIAAEHGMDPALCPTIHYHLTPESPLESVEERFNAVFSSHCIEHQPDLIGHLQAVERLLRPGGAYFLIVPDKRYCFDHFRPETTVADVMAARVERRTNHDLRSVLAHHALSAHNDHFRHWAGDHGAPAIVGNPHVMQQAANAYEAAAGTYIDTHAWQFTPESFAEILDLLHRSGEVALQPQKVHPTLQNRNEFCAVLSRAA